MAKHVGKPQYKCDQCQRRFYHLSGYKRHLQHHSDLRPFSCEVSGNDRSCWQFCSSIAYIGSVYGASLFLLNWYFNRSSQNIACLHPFRSVEFRKNCLEQLDCKVYVCTINTTSKLLRFGFYFVCLSFQCSVLTVFHDSTRYWFIIGTNFNFHLSDLWENIQNKYQSKCSQDCAQADGIYLYVWQDLSTKTYLEITSREMPHAPRGAGQSVDWGAVPYSRAEVKKRDGKRVNSVSLWS